MQSRATIARGIRNKLLFIGKKALTPYGESAISVHTPALRPNSIPHQQVLQAQEDDVGERHLHPFIVGISWHRTFTLSVIPAKLGPGFLRASSPAPAKNFAEITVACWSSRAFQHAMLQACVWSAQALARRDITCIIGQRFRLNVCSTPERRSKSRYAKCRSLTLRGSE
jgi:hypothetical protein